MYYVPKFREVIKKQTDSVDGFSFLLLNIEQSENKHSTFSGSEFMQQPVKLSAEQEKELKKKRKLELKRKRDQMQKKEKQALWLSLSAGIAFAVVEFLFAIFTHSQSVLMDSVYDTSELVFIVLILYLTPLFYKPISESHPYGYFQLESIFLIVKGFMMLSVTFGVSADIIQSTFSGGNPVDESLISVFQLILGSVSLVIYFIMKNMNRDLSSPTVDTEILEWRLDIWYSLGLSLAFFASTFLSRTPLAFLAPYVDPVIAIVVMAMMMPETVKMLWGAIRDVFLFSPDEETVETIKAICNEQMAEEKITPVYVDVTRTGRQMWVAVYFDTDALTLSVSGLRRVTDEVTQKLREVYENCTCELLLLPKKGREN